MRIKRMRSNKTIKGLGCWKIEKKKLKSIEIFYSMPIKQITRWNKH